MAEVELGLRDYAKYPFLKEAGDYARALGVTVEDLEQHYQPVVERARERVMEAIRRRVAPTEVLDTGVEILSFPLALMFVKATGLDHLVARYSLAEAIRAERLLEDEDHPLLIHIFKGTFGMEPELATDGMKAKGFDFKIPVQEYLKRLIQFHSPEWKLVNRIMDRGSVYLKSHALIRLIREEIRSLIYSRMKALPVPRLPDGLRAIVGELSETASRLAPSKERLEVTPGAYPPCVMHVLDLIQKGQNPSHFSRFLLTTYLLGIGKSVDEVMSMSKGTPDFDERIARYQVEHIAGLRGGRTRYKVPTCKTVLTQGACYRDEVLCANIVSPLQFGRKPLEVGKRRAKKG